MAVGGHPPVGGVDRRGYAGESSSTTDDRMSSAGSVFRCRSPNVFACEVGGVFASENFSLVGRERLRSSKVSRSTGRDVQYTPSINGNQNRVPGVHLARFEMGDKVGFGSAQLLSTTGTAKTGLRVITKGDKLC